MANPISTNQFGGFGQIPGQSQQTKAGWSQAVDKLRPAGTTPGAAGTGSQAPAPPPSMPTAPQQPSQDTYASMTAAPAAKPATGAAGQTPPGTSPSTPAPAPTPAAAPQTPPPQAPPATPPPPSSYGDMNKPPSYHAELGNFGDAGAWTNGYNPHMVQDAAPPPSQYPPGTFPGSSTSPAATPAQWAGPPGTSALNADGSINQQPWYDPKGSADDNENAFFRWEASMQANGGSPDDQVRTYQASLTPEQLAVQAQGQAARGQETNAYQIARDAALGMMNPGSIGANGVDYGKAQADPSAALAAFDASGYTGQQALADGWATGVGTPGWVQSAPPPPRPYSAGPVAQGPLDSALLTNPTANKAAPLASTYQDMSAPDNHVQMPTISSQYPPGTFPALPKTTTTAWRK